MQRKVRRKEAESVRAENSLCQEERDLVAELGRRITRLRDAKGWSRSELATRLGVSRGRLGHWERGGHAPPLGIQIALSRELEIPLGELLTGEKRAELEWTRGVRTEAERHLEVLRRLLDEADRRGGPAGETPETEGR
jgi:transcriptional regulator with XRE-family HTH domain